MGRTNWGDPRKGCLLPRLPDPLGTQKPPQTLVVRQKQPGVGGFDAERVHRSMPQKAIPHGTPQPPSPLLAPHPGTGRHL